MSDVDGALRFELDPLTSAVVRELIADHLAWTRSQTPPESVHALEIDGLQDPDVKFWSVWLGPELVGCGALKKLSATDGEIKSMHVRSAWRGRGIAGAILAHIEAAARTDALGRLWLETGSEDAYAPARRLYAAAGYTRCPPFGDYTDDPLSTFMTKPL